jgi:hypothetical protein
MTVAVVMALIEEEAAFNSKVGSSDREGGGGISEGTLAHK